MNALLYPIHLQRDFERRWAARGVRDETRQSPPEGTDTCRCGRTAIAPYSSTYSPNGVANYWKCSACGRRWKSTASSGV
jgi:hypothetical protein